MCLAVTQSREGKKSLAEFIANRGSKAVDEAVSLAKEFSEAEEKPHRSKKSRLDMLQESKDSECVNGCEGKWLEAARQLLERQEEKNSVHNLPYGTRTRLLRGIYSFGTCTTTSILISIHFTWMHLI